MERSQSCSSFERNYLYSNNNNSTSSTNSNNSSTKNNKDNNNNMNNRSASAHNLRKAIELRQNQLQQQQQQQEQQQQQQQHWQLQLQQQFQQHHQQQQQQQQQLQQQLQHQLLQQRQLQQLQQLQQQQQQQQLHRNHSGSNDNIHTLNALNLSHFGTSMRKKTPLRRQKTPVYGDDADYAADMEEDDDYDDEREHTDKARTLMTAYLPSQQHLAHMHTTTLIIDTNANSTALSTCSSSTSNGKSSTAIAAIAATALVQPSRVMPLGQLSFELATAGHPSVMGGGVTTAASTPSPLSRRHQFALKRDNSLQSDSSRYSSVDSLLESRKPDPEAILINLGFGPASTEDILSRIPKRFLKPSQVRGIDTEAFVKRLQLASSLADHSALGYRGLTGNPDIPPSSIVAKIMERFEVNERKKSMGSIEHHIR